MLVFELVVLELLGAVVLMMLVMVLLVFVRRRGRGIHQSRVPQ